MSTATTPVSTSPVVQALQRVLADSYSLMAETHLAHWNVEGSDFFALHAAFQSQYEELFQAVDELAERIRALDAYSPGGLKTLSSLSQVEELPQGRVPAKDFVAGLVDAHEKTVEGLVALREASEKSGDLETQDIAIGRIQVHQKTLWFLKSYLKK